MQEIALVAALSYNNVIGSNGQIPWNLRDDLKYFQQLTKGHIVIMGRKTWDSLPKKPLKDRVNIVVTTQPQVVGPDPIIALNYDEALQRATDISLADNKKIFVIGGSSAYNHFLPLAQHLYLTHVNARLDGDTFFPQYNPRLWNVEDVARANASARNDYSFVTQHYSRTLGQ